VAEKEPGTSESARLGFAFSALFSRAQRQHLLGGGLWRRPIRRSCRVLRAERRLRNASERRHDGSWWKRRHVERRPKSEDIPGEGCVSGLSCYCTFFCVESCFTMRLWKRHLVFLCFGKQCTQLLSIGIVNNTATNIENIIIFNVSVQSYNVDGSSLYYHTAIQCILGLCYVI